MELDVENQATGISEPETKKGGLSLWIIVFGVVVALGVVIGIVIFVNREEQKTPYTNNTPALTTPKVSLSTPEEFLALITNSDESIRADFATGKTLESLPKEKYGTVTKEYFDVAQNLINNAEFKKLNLKGKSADEVATALKTIKTQPAVVEAFKKLPEAIRKRVELVENTSENNIIYGMDDPNKGARECKAAKEAWGKLFPIGLSAENFSKDEFAVDRMKKAYEAVSTACVGDKDFSKTFDVVLKEKFDSMAKETTSAVHLSSLYDKIKGSFPNASSFTSMDFNAYKVSLGSSNPTSKNIDSATTLDAYIKAVLDLSKTDAECNTVVSAFLAKDVAMGAFTDASKILNDAVKTEPDVKKAFLAKMKAELIEGIKKSLVAVYSKPTGDVVAEFAKFVARINYIKSVGEDDFSKGADFAPLAAAITDAEAKKYLRSVFKDHFISLATVKGKGTTTEADITKIRSDLKNLIDNIKTGDPADPFDAQIGKDDKTFAADYGITLAGGSSPTYEEKMVALMTQVEKQIKDGNDITATVDDIIKVIKAHGTEATADARWAGKIADAEIKGRFTQLQKVEATKILKEAVVEVEKELVKTGSVVKTVVGDQTAKYQKYAVLVDPAVDAIKARTALTENVITSLVDQFATQVVQLGKASTFAPTEPLMVKIYALIKDAAEFETAKVTKVLGALTGTSTAVDVLNQLITTRGEIKELDSLIEAIDETAANAALMDSLKKDLKSHVHFKALFDAVKGDTSKSFELQDFFLSYIECKYAISNPSADLIKEIKATFDYYIELKLSSRPLYANWGKDFSNIPKFIALLDDAFAVSKLYNYDIKEALDWIKKKNVFIIVNDPTGKSVAEDLNSKVLQFIALYHTYDSLLNISGCSLSTSSAAATALAKLANPFDADVTAYITNSINNIKTITNDEISAAQQVVTMQLEFTSSVADRPALFGKLADLSEFKAKDANKKPWKACEDYVAALDNFSLLNTAVNELNNTTPFDDNYYTFINYLTARMDHSEALVKQTPAPVNVAVINNLKKAIGILKIALNSNKQMEALAAESISGTIVGITRENLISNLNDKNNLDHVDLVHNYKSHAKAFGVLFSTKDATVDKLLAKLNDPSTIKVPSCDDLRSEFDDFIAYEAVKASMVSNQITFVSKKMTTTGANAIVAKMNTPAEDIFKKFVTDAELILGRTTPTPPATPGDLMVELNKDGNILKKLELEAKKFEDSEIEHISMIMHCNGITADMLPK